MVRRTDGNIPTVYICIHVYIYIGIIYIYIFIYVYIVKIQAIEQTKGSLC